MKLSYYFLFAFLLLHIHVSAQWTIKNLDENSSKIGNIKFQNDSLGYFIGGDSYFLKTIDSGESWQKQQIDINISIGDYQLIGDSSIFAVGNSKLIKSKDNGSNWDSISNLAGKQLLSLWFFDNDSGLVAGYNGIYRTINTGSSWDTVWSITQFGYKYGDVKRLYFPSDKVGYAIGTGRNQHNDPNFDHFLLKSTDSGKTWEKIKSFSGNLTTICFTNEKTGFLGTESGIIYKTLDGGSIWTESLITPSGTPIKSIQFITDTRGYATGGVTNYITGSGSENNFFISNTIDGGQSWASYDTTGVALNSIHFISANKGFVAGDFELIMKSNGVNNLLPENYPWHLFETVGIKYNCTINSKVIIYPNPTNGILIVKNQYQPQKIKKVQLFNLSGKQMDICNRAVDNNLIQLNLSGLTSGSYLLQVVCDDKIEISKIIKR
ncbi:T9SS type A sorting domain-containing protein [Prolixibacteraceae bacterium JC049]|nr:T9SS type A sorting domain-containing protein [Prolixibacteraceae bacterium JC049]